MANYIAKKPWEFEKITLTSERDYLNRRQLVKKIGLITGSAICFPFLNSCGNNQSQHATSNKNSATDIGGNTFNFDGMDQLYPAQRNTKYRITDRPLTEEYHATHKNNFYEFISRQDPDIYNVYKFVDQFTTSNWKIECTGLIENPGTYDLVDLIKKFGLEERTYRFRCVERWSMAVPWTGMPLKRLIKFLNPTSNARFIKLYSYNKAEEMEGVRNLTHYPWPYTEGLSIPEAMHELAFLATGIYGKPLPKQNGAPIRLVVPWKYGYKNIKSIVRIDFVESQPDTFWHTVAPKEYPFVSNVDPDVPHPRWSQAYEKMIPDGALRLTLKYNGYGEMVANLY